MEDSTSRDGCQSQKKIRFLKNVFRVRYQRKIRFQPEYESNTDAFVMLFELPECDSTRHKELEE